MKRKVTPLIYLSALLLALIGFSFLIWQLSEIGYEQAGDQEIEIENFRDPDFISSRFYNEPEILLVTSDYPPFIYTNGEFSVMTEIISQALDAVGIDYRIEYYPWSRCLTMIDQGLAFGTFCWIETEERLRKYEFSETVFVYDGPATTLFYDASRFDLKAEDFSTYEGFSGYRLGGAQNYWYMKGFLDNNTDIEVHADERLLFEKLVEGHIDIVPAEYYIGKFILKEIENSGSIESIPFLLDEENYSFHKILLKRGNKRNAWFTEQFSEGLKIIRANGTYGAMIRLVEEKVKNE